MNKEQFIKQIEETQEAVNHLWDSNLSEREKHDLAKRVIQIAKKCFHEYPEFPHLVFDPEGKGMETVAKTMALLSSAHAQSDAVFSDRFNKILHNYIENQKVPTYAQDILYWK